MSKITKSVEWVASEVARRPLNAVAKEIGVSDVGLGLFCKRHKVQVFGPNHFRKLNLISKVDLCPICGGERKVRKHVDVAYQRGFVFRKSCLNCNASNQRIKVRGQRKSKGLCIGCGKEPQPGLNYCIECHAVSVRNKRLRSRLRKDKLVKLMGGKCNKCGGQFHNAAYDFHHLSDKLGAISRMVMSTWENVLAELKKCELFCAVCHRLEHKYQLIDISRVKFNSVLYRRAFVQNYKTKPCQDCGNQYHPTAMEFDHRFGVVKLFNISNVACKKYSMDELLVEIAKCDVVCVNCHRVRTFKRGCKVID